MLLALRKHLWGTWVAQLVKRPTLGFGSGHDLMLCVFKSHVGLCAGRDEPSWDSLSLPVFLKINKHKKKETFAGTTTGTHSTDENTGLS